jgi:predicted transcriptional regulator
MPRQSIDRLKVRELHDKGLNTVEIAKECGATKSAISKVLRQMGREVTTAAVRRRLSMSRRNRRPRSTFSFSSER